MRQLSGKVVALTGAASGIGRALALRLGREGAELALCDLDEAGVRETAARVTGSPRVGTRVVDVSDRRAVEEWARCVEAEHGGADVIVNNAGVTAKGSIEELPWEDFRWVVDVDLWGVIHGVRAFLPLLRRRPEGHIVNISSITAFVPLPDNGPYNIAKSGVAALSETLMLELAGSGIGVTCVHPGGIRTNIARGARHMTADDHARFDRAARTDPDAAARAIVEAVRSGRQRLFIGADAKLLSLSRRGFPMTTLALVRRFWSRAQEQAGG
jgi:NAD(P)-dependent dehydrogenase (short-subunit alcohol dehydrogenase family)